MFRGAIIQQHRSRYNLWRSRPANRGHPMLFVHHVRGPRGTSRRPRSGVPTTSSPTHGNKVLELFLLEGQSISNPRHRGRPGLRSPISWPAPGHARPHWYPRRRPGGVTAVR